MQLADIIFQSYIHDIFKFILLFDYVTKVGLFEYIEE